MDNTKAQETMDAELIALAALVMASSRQMEMADRDRLSHGYSVAYGDCAAEGQDELSTLLTSRGVLPSAVSAKLAPSERDALQDEVELKPIAMHGMSALVKELTGD